MGHRQPIASTSKPPKALLIYTENQLRAAIRTPVPFFDAKGYRNDRENR